MDTKAPKLNGERYEDIETLLSRLHIVPAVEPSRLGRIASSSTPGWAWV